MLCRIHFEAEAAVVASLHFHERLLVFGAQAVHHFRAHGDEEIMLGVRVLLAIYVLNLL